MAEYPVEILRVASALIARHGSQAAAVPLPDLI